MRAALTVPTIVVLVAGSSLSLQAQQMPPELPPEVQGWITELENIQAELGPIQQEAMQDPQLRAEQEELSRELFAAMSEIDPTVPEQTERMGELSARVQAAQAAGDEAEVMQIAGEAQQIQQQLARVQSQALDHPAVAPRVADFEARLQGKMVEIEPGAERLIQRHQELERRVMDALGGPGGP